jgi:hypothetical protein
MSPKPKCTVEIGIITVRSAFGMKSTQVGAPSPEAFAKTMLRELADMPPTGRLRAMSRRANCSAVHSPSQLLTVDLIGEPTPLSESFDRIDLVADRFLRLHFRHLVDLRRAGSGHPRMCEIESLVETYLIAKRDLVPAVDAAGGAVPLCDTRS